MNSDKPLNSLRTIFINRLVDNDNHSNKKIYTKNTVMSVLVCVLIVLSIYIVLNPSGRNVGTLLVMALLVCVALYFVYRHQVPEYPLTGNFVCPHCLKNILIEKIEKITCPYCDAENLNFKNVLLGCPQCDDYIRFLNCPYCNEEIDLFAPYNINKLKGQRFE